MAGIIFKINPLEWSSLIIVIGLVFLAELLNTSLENMADIIKPEWNDRIGNAKDYAAAAVLISAIIGGCCWRADFYSKNSELIKRTTA